MQKKPPNVKSSGCVSMAGSRCFRVDASRADGQTVCGYRQHYVRWGVFAALLPEPNGEPDAEEQSSAEHAGEMNCFLSALKSVPSETNGFITVSSENRP